MVRAACVKDLRVMLDSKRYFHRHVDYLYSHALRLSHNFSSLDNLKFYVLSQFGQSYSTRLPPGTTFFFFFAMALQPFVGPWPHISVSKSIFTQTVGLLGRVISQSQGLYLYTGQHKHRINAYTNIHASVGFEPTIPGSERAKTVHALDRSATVTGGKTLLWQILTKWKIYIESLQF
jgi:hypothetical protein